MRAGGANVILGPQLDIGGTLEAGGANVSMAGHVSGPAKLAGAAVTFSGQADGPLTLAGDRIVIASGARIGGNLTIYSREAPSIAADAVVSGVVQRMEPPSWWSSIQPWMWAVGLAVAVVIGTLLAGIVLALLGGRILANGADHLRLRPVTSFVIGLITVILIPAIAAILMATIAGLSVGIALLLVLPLLCVFGHAVAAAGIGAGIFVRSRLAISTGYALLLLIAGALIIVIIGFIPWVGLLALGVVLLLGVGALVRAVGARLRGTPPLVSAGDLPPRAPLPPPPPPKEMPPAESPPAAA